MKRFVTAMSIALAGTGAAQADGLGDLMFSGTEFDFGVTYSFGPVTDVTGFDASALTFLDIGSGMSVGLGLAHSAQSAFGLPFSATTLSVHPGYDFPMGEDSLDGRVRVGAYGSATVTMTPAAFSPFFGYGLEASFSAERFSFSGHAGLYDGANIANPLNNTTLGVYGKYAVTEKFDLFAAYDRDAFGFWGNTVTGYELGARYDLSDILGTGGASAELSLGRLDVNGIDYTQIRAGVRIAIDRGNDEPDHDSDGLMWQSLALRQTFSF